jgi:NADH-quinone oxidoreductase subunit F
MPSRRRSGTSFLRWAYKEAERRLRKAIAEAYEAGYLGKNILGSGFDFDLHLHVSAGRYMCGEETGLLNSLEGRRAIPRAKPPFPQVSGLWGQPTIVNNVETLSCVPHPAQRGGLVQAPEPERRWRNETIRRQRAGQARPGLWELPMGTTMREILFEHAGGMQEGYQFRGLCRAALPPIS